MIEFEVEINFEAVVDLGVHMGVVVLPLSQGGELVHQLVHEEAQCWIVGEFFVLNQGIHSVFFRLGRILNQSQGVGKC